MLKERERGTNNFGRVRAVRPPKNRTYTLSIPGRFPAFYEKIWLFGLFFDPEITASCGPFIVGIRAALRCPLAESRFAAAQREVPRAAKQRHPWRESSYAFRAQDSL